MRPLWPLLLALSSAALAQTMFAVPEPPVRGQLDADAGRTLPGTPLPGTIQTSPDDGGILPEPSTTYDAGMIELPPTTPSTIDAGMFGPVAPPYGLAPPALLQDSPARYPPELAPQRVSGEVALLLDVDAQGTVSAVELSSGVHPILDAAALSAARGLKFGPATLDGRPVAVRVPFRYRFEAPRIEPPAAAPRARLTGEVRSRGNRRPVPGAILRVEGAAPVEADAQGRFSLEVPPGPVWVRVSAPGYLDQAQREQLRSGDEVEVRYALEPLELNPYETIVRGEKETRTEVSRFSLREQELREVPGTMGDPFRVVTLLPGVATPISGLAYPIVRGSQPAATAYFIDGVRVPVLFHLFLGPSVVHPDFIEGIDFYPGAPPPEYARNIGGVIAGQASRPREDRLHGTASLDFLNASLFVEKPFPSTGTSVGVAGRVSYTGWLISAASKAFLDLGPSAPNVVLDFWDYQARIEQRLGAGRLRLLALGSSDRFGLESTGPSSIGALPSIAFHRVDLRYQRPLGARADLELAATYGVDRLGIDGNTPAGTVATGPLNTAAGRFGFHLDDTPLTLRGKASFGLGDGLTLRVGGDVEQRRSRFSIVATLPAVGDLPPLPVDAMLPLAVATFAGTWTQLVWEPAGWTISPALRFDHYHLVPGKNFEALEPRLTVRRQLTDALALKGGAGLFHMPPTTLINVPAVSVGGIEYGLQQQLQFDLGAEWKAREGLELSADAYVNPLLRAVELDPFDLPGATPRPAPIEDGAAIVQIPEFNDPATHGLAYGFELMVRHPIGQRWFGWLSYSFSNSWRKVRFAREATGEEVSAYVPFSWEQAHVLNGVISYRLPGNYTLGLVAHLNTGRPEAGMFGTTRVPGADPQTGAPHWIPADPDRLARLPAFFRVDLRAAKTWAFDTFALEAYVDLLNASLSRETLGYTYTDQDLQRTAVELPVVLPSIGVKGTY